MTTDIEALLRSFSWRIERLGPDAVRVIDRLIAKFEDGHVRHGMLDLTRDQRHWLKEAGEELDDAVFYVMFRFVQAEDATRARLRAEAAAEPGVP